MSVIRHPVIRTTGALLRLAGLFATASVAFALTAQAAFVPSIDAPGLIDAADLIVVGRADRPELRTTSRRPVEAFSIAVDRVIKGDASASRVAVEIDLSDPANATLSGESYGLFFLRRGGDGTYTAASPYQLMLGASARAPAGGKSGALRAVAAELAGVLSAAPAQLAGTFEQGQHIQLQAASLLKTIPYASAAPLLRKMAGAAQASTRLWALYGLLHMGDADPATQGKLDLLLALQPVLLNPHADATFAATLVAEVFGKVNSPDVVAPLIALLASRSAAVRRGAAQVLSRSDDDGAVKALARTALADGDPTVRYYAVRALARRSGGDVPSEDSFEQNDARLSAHWRTWADANLR